MAMTQAQSAAVAQIFLGQYKAGGRGELCPVRHVPLYNCWGLCIAVGAVFGHRIPEVAAPAVPTARVVNGLYERFCAEFMPLDQPKAGCLVAFRTHPRMARAVNHFGIMLDAHNFVHIQRDTAVHVVRVDVQPYSRFFAGFYWARLEGGCA
ncbi:MAG: NlpC/P60 family protein [Desulfovibrionaceae bacterium]|nr:NlpC/P60 family protein [Desulfovibrionaceae bacterium]